jgi:hypothetical protein
MLAKVQYTGPDGILRTILAQVPDDAPSPYTFIAERSDIPRRADHGRTAYDGPLVATG